jgi:uncharacterized protein
MALGSKITRTSVDHHRLVTLVVVSLTVLIALAAGLPALAPGALPFLHTIEVDTDPENMLASDEPVRLFHDHMKSELALHDMVVVGVVNDVDPDGVFNPASLARIHELTAFAGTLHGERIGEPEGEGVVTADLISPSTVDNIEPGAGTVKFSWLMPEPPATREQARAIRDSALRVPFLNGTLVSEDGKAVAIYVPLTRKDLSYRVSAKLREKIATFDGDDRFHITGLPVAEDTFGVEMFIQMAISAPSAMAVIFVLMLLFFRKLVIVVSPLLVAMISVVLTMGSLITAGFPIHIMSSMIPIFIMPIAVLDSIHIISEFFEKYQETRDRRRTVLAVMDELFAPMLYTSLTSAAGFASLALTPIPPVQVFGVFVAAGIMVAWLLTITFIPAFVMFIPPRTLENFGATRAGGDETRGSAITRFLHWMSGATYRRAKLILVVAGVALVIAAWGISRINVNDNPVKWFTKSHSIRVADRVLNSHFGGTYMAYLALIGPTEAFDAEAFAADLAAGAVRRGEQHRADNPQAADVFARLAELARGEPTRAKTREAFFRSLQEQIDTAMGRAAAPTAAPAPPTPDGPTLPGGLEGPGGPALPGGLDSDGPALPNGIGGDAPDVPSESALTAAERDAWNLALLFVDEQRQANELFKDPVVLAYQLRLQEELARSPVVGKTNSLADIVRTVHRDFVSGEPKDYRIPPSRPGVAQMLIQYQSSHRANDLWHFVTPDYRTSAMWVQLTSGNNRDMSKVADQLAGFVKSNPPPAGLTPKWFGLTYINVVWQEKMVWGMLEAFAGSFLVVLLLMTLLFRSALWGLLSMIPLTVTIASIYGAVGIVGKDYDMPVAVLSSLTLGLAVDFAIHFLARSRAMHASTGSWKAALPGVFGEPARAIAKNIIVIAAGFLPLLLAPLLPYRTVGVLLATILLVSGVGTLVLLPAIVRLLEKPLFAPDRKMGITCHCVTCIVSAAAVAALVVMNVYRYLSLGWNWLVLIGLVIVAVAALACRLLSRRTSCTVSPDSADQEK